jgi:segregation and condensation protein B
MNPLHQPDTIPMSEPEIQLSPTIEAILLASPQPISVKQLYELFSEQALTPGSVEQALTALKSACDGRGVELTEVASGWRYQVKAEVHPYVARLWTERQGKYTRATLETLALIAYRQPITRGEIEQIRGVSVSSSMIKSLEEREWIRVLGHRDVPGRPELFGTTKTFLDYFGLKSLDALPPLAELKEYPELEPQLSFDISEPFTAQVTVITEPSETAGDTSEASPSSPETHPSADHVETTTDETQP